MGLFYLLVLYCFLRGVGSARAIFWYAASMLACLLGMASKEVMVSAPLMVLLYDRTFCAGSFREAWRRRYGFYLALAGTWLLLGWLVATTGHLGNTAGSSAGKFTWWSYLWTQPGVIAHYLRLALWPFGLCLDYGWPAVQTVDEVLFPVILVVGLLGLTAWALFRWPEWGFLGVWFFAILAPTSSFLPLQDAAFEHRLYLPLAAIVTGVVAGGVLAGRSYVRSASIPSLQAHLVVGSLAVLACVALGVLTFYRNLDYRSDLSIWQDTAAKAPNSSRGHTSFGVALAARERYDEAIAQYQTALSINPDDVLAHNNLGAALIGRGLVDDAMAHYRKVLELQPDDVKAHSNLGVALVRKGRLDEAIVEYQKALELDSRIAELHGNLGNALARRGRLDEAIAEYEKALEIKPDDAKARYNLGGALCQQRRIPEAIAQWNELVRLQPDSAMALGQVAWVLASSPEASVRNGAKAVELAGRAAKLTGGRDAEVLDTLAAAYAEAGRFPEAVATAQQALPLATVQSNLTLVDSLRTQIGLYQAGSPFRDTSPTNALTRAK
jgi:protein O-mannosyl-transferase